MFHLLCVGVMKAVMKALAGSGSLIAIEGFGALYCVFEQTTLSFAYTSISTIRKCPNIVDWDVRHQTVYSKCSKISNTSA